MLTGTLAALVAAAGLGVGPVPGHDFDSRVIFATPKHNLPLLNLPPYPARRVSSPDRPELGRVWVSRTPGEKIAESIFPGPGPQSLGAEPGLAGALIYAQTRTPLPAVALSPWQTIDDATFDDIRRLRPWIKNERRGEVLADLREAQQAWLRQNGYVRTVRTHVNADLHRGVEAEGADAGTDGMPVPSGVIRVRPVEEPAEDQRADRPVPKVLPMIRDVAAYVAARDTTNSQAIAAMPEAR
jgi:hypothetical protein